MNFEFALFPKEGNVYCLMGPTATGKTDLAIQLSTQFPIEIISVDSAMVYRGMDIGTAKPSQEILEKIPHHLIDILNPEQIYSAADFCQDAKKIILDILERGKIPLLVGGTMLYFKALQQGLSELPSANPEVRKQILAEAEVIGWEAMHRKLQTVDSKSAARIHPNDSQRIERALEVYYLTGKSLSENFEQSPVDNTNAFKINSIGLFPKDRALLHQRIEKRFHEMLSAGFIEEVRELMKTLQEKGYDPFSCASMRMVGYRQASLYLSGQMDEKTMIEKSIIATRQLAKRQMTWLRSWSNIQLIDPFEN